MTSRIAKLIAYHLPILGIFCAVVFFVAKVSVQAEVTAGRVELLDGKSSALEKAAWAIPRIEADIKEMRRELREIRKVLIEARDSNDSAL